MPGPCNLKKRKKLQVKKGRKCSSVHTALDDEHANLASAVDISTYDILASSVMPEENYGPREEEGYGDGIVPQMPYIHDPGNGPRVRDTRAFLSSFFAQPPTLDDPLCAEFAQDEVLQMLCTVLPDETALILWYNKSRATGRICPACRRLYCLGDVLPDLIEDGLKSPPQRSPLLTSEQKISGLCSPVCFILASFEYPGAIKTTWGRIAEDMDDYTWQLLNGPGQGSGDMGLSLLLKMTRLDDLGLGQLCLPEVDFDSGWEELQA
ncbi:hypothetical protein SERLA73DRAFT_162822 [Serpula lacrymans var. lacrymans S7.3]|uniref:Uncharacterized protein n=2 Tax=Serpula lacrymans var. lacrymans TaxID=341189 RepID=F8QAC5_SERL3|nr:uncharacterized protein SERLADRAFT_417966 [Serpula lacrymans var. lacrymans S7.9]EGN94715.1 hypothetical protein SERLA73DRAFT_162822 [Serpula lacrymans var. lacrymans S7.3]EGO20194.1 hypothetical protein SERLADRAFT_417966 [Serpula lacrymans var. lacrymans S7.9]